MKRTLHTRTRFFHLLLCLILAVAIQAQNKPNVIVILADDMGFSDIEPYGGEIMTPNLTELSENGIRFNRFYNTTKCSPTRASLLTGQYSHEAGMEDLSNAGGNQSPAFLGYLPDNVVTMAEAFKSNGYGTYLSGKWHIGEDQGHWPRDRGFDRCWGLISGASSYYEIISMDDNPNQKADRKMVLDDQLWDPDDTNDPNNPYAPGEFFMTDATSDFAIEFLNDHFQTQNNNPFFLYLSFTAPHWPLHAHESDIDKYDGAYSQGYEAIRNDRFAQMKTLGILNENADLSPKDHNKKWENLNASSKAEEERKMQVYAAMVDRMDQNIGRIMDQLKANGKFNNTIIVFLSDNGGSREDVSGRKLNDPNKEIGEKGSYVAYERPWSNVSNTPFRQHKNDTYEGGVVTPMIIHHPASINVPTGGVFTDQIAHVKDLMPTLLEMTNSNYPFTYGGNVIKEMSGRSFKHNMDDVNEVEQWEIFFEYSGNRAVRHGNWKAVSESANGEWFLFNMEEDPVELSSVAGSYPDIVDQLDKRYELWEVSVNHASGTLPNPNNAPVLLNPVEDQVIRENRLFTFIFDDNTFTDDPDDDMVYEATLANGDDLPEWLAFDDLLRQFSGIPPVGSLNTPIEIRLVAVDWAENKTIDEFQFILDPQNTGGNNDPLTCLLVVDDPNLLNASDQEIKDRIELLGYELTMVSDEDATTEDADEKTIVVISSTVSPGKIGTKFKEIEAGVVTWEVSLFPEMGFTGPTTYQDFGGQGSQTSMIIENEDHPLAGGLEAGTQVVMDKPKTFYFGIPSNEAITIATQLSNTDRKNIFAYEEGAQMVGSEAAGRRVGLFMRDQGARDFNNNGWALFDAALCWAANDCNAQTGIEISFTTPMDMESFPEGTDLTVQVAASDADGTITEVELTLNGDLVRTLTNPPYIWSANNDPLLADMSPGIYTLESTATDNLGNIESTSIEIMVESTHSGNQDPVVSFDTPQDGDVFTEGDDLTVQVNASDPDGTITKVMLYFDGVSVRDITTAPYEWGTNGNDPMLQNLAVGTHTLRTVAMDDAGAASETTITITVTSMMSNMLPEVSFVTPTDGQNFPEGTDLDVRVNAEDSDGTISSVKLYFDGQMVSEDTEAPYEWENEPLLNNLTAGTYTLQATATDNDNGTTQTSIQITVVEAGTNILPNVSYITPQHGDHFPVGTDLLVQVAADDPDGFIHRVHLYVNGDLLRRDFDAPYEWDGAGGDSELSNLQEGTYTLEAAGIDNDNEYTVNTIMITVGGTGNEEMPPVVSFNTPTDGQSFEEGTDLMVNVNASDPDGDVTEVALYFDGQLVGNDSSAPYEWGNNDPLLENLQIGAHTLRTVATDNDGLTAEETIIINVSSNSNMSPMVSFMSPTDGQSFEEGTDLYVKVEASDSDGSIASVDLYFDGNLVRTETTNPYEWGNGEFSDDALKNLSAGTHTLRTVATDDEGATAEQTIQIQVTTSSGNALPVVTFIEPEDGDTFPEGTDLYVKVEATDPDGSIRNVRLYINGDYIRKESIAPYEWGEGTNNNDPELQNLSVGQYELTAVAFDNSGDRTQESIFINVTASGLAHLIRDTATENENTITANHQQVVATENTNTATDDAAEVIENRSEEIPTIIELKFDIYPNPTSQQLSIQWQAAGEQSMNLKLYNALGQVVHVQNVKTATANDVKWNVESLASGIYLLEIRNDKGLLRSEKVVISREN